MEIQLQELIEQIKKNGVAVAENAAEQIINSANLQAEKIIADAKAKAEKMVADAKSENLALVAQSEQAIAQAGRNMLISFRQSVAKELDALAGEQINGLYSSSSFAELITKVVLSWSEQADGNICLMLTEEDRAALEAQLISKFKEHVKGTVTVKTSNSFDKGFRIALDGGRIYYDYSAEAVLEMLSAYLNPRIINLLKEAEGV